MPAWAALYAAMFGATLAGQVAGMILDALIGQRLLWLPALCSVILEAVVGARMARPAGAGAAAKLSARYSLALAAASLPLAAWVAAEKGYDLGYVLAVGAAAIAAATMVRAALLAVFSALGGAAPRGRSAA